MRYKVKERTEDKNCVAEDQCHHYWVIEVANGPRSRGVCKYCGEARYFLNMLPDFNALKRKSKPLWRID